VNVFVVWFIKSRLYLVKSNKVKLVANENLEPISDRSKFSRFSRRGKRYLDLSRRPSGHRRGDVKHSFNKTASLDYLQCRRTYIHRSFPGAWSTRQL